MSVDELAKVVWDYHHVNHSLKKSDCILVLGSHDIRVADRGAELFFQGWAPLLIFSGGLGRLTKEIWHEAEADKFAKRAINLGVSKDKVLIENKATNTGENLKLTRELLREKGIKVNRIIVVQKPYMERRADAAFKEVWPEVEAIITSPQISFEDYPNEEISKNDVINIMVGDLQRIKLYPEKGFQVPQEIPDDVWSAYEQLVKLGYSDHLIKT